MAQGYPLFVKRDLDGFFGLAIDNLVQWLLIITLCKTACGMNGENEHFIYNHILPGAAISLVIGNLFYAFQAHRLAKREGRSDVTALPFGINTPSLIVYVFFVMLPAYQMTRSAQAAWLMGLIACLGSGVIEFTGAFYAEWIRRHTPRAALLSTLAGIAIGFIAMTFALQIWQRPLIAMLPLGVVLITYFSGIRFPGGIPGGLLAVGGGTILAWVLTLILPGDWLGRTMSAKAVEQAWALRGWHPPIWAGGELWRHMYTAWHDEAQRKLLVGSISVIVPMGLFNVIGSLQNIESAEAGGDRFHTGSSLAVNGLSTIAAALFGSCFPTTIYIGHPGWKGLGARAGYSTLNGLFFTVIGLTGTVAVINAVVPIEAGIAIVVWIGIIITAQAYQTTPREHAPAVAVGLFPAIAAWGATVAAGVFIVAGGKSMQAILATNPTADANGFLLHGMNILERGYIFTCMILAAISALLIDRKFFTAAIWSLTAAALTFVGLMHAYQLRDNTVDYLLIWSRLPHGAFGTRAHAVAVGYVLLAALFAAIGWYRERWGGGNGIDDVRLH
ncbi:MAG TPA: NCS2 family permease [Phycisphaerae bacterium]|nr:NCS2 family permease [Phycisphaerae bacterium]